MVSWRGWWYDLLLVCVTALTLVDDLNQPPVPWAVYGPSLALFLVGYGLIRPSLSQLGRRSSTSLGYIGCVLMVVGIALGSYEYSSFSLLLTVACPVAWGAVSTRAAGIGWTIALVGVVMASVLAQLAIRGGLAQQWWFVVLAAASILTLSTMLGSMLFALQRWGQERAELVADLKASQADLAESYRQLVADSAGAPRPAPTTEQSVLSEREIEVLTLVSAGLTNREIGQRLFISPATVKTHMEHILTKLGATTRTQAVLLAHRDGLLSSATTA